MRYRKLRLGVTEHLEDAPDPPDLYGRRLKDGSIRIVVDARPGKRGRFHTCTHAVPPLQWLPETGVTRYEWERGKTPKAQRAFFQHLSRIYRRSPPEPGAPDPGIMIEAGEPEFLERVTSTSIETRDPSGEWCFRITAETWTGVVCDRVAVWHHDGRTMPDWNMILRVRSWVLADGREAFLWLPDQDGEGLGRYQNERFNALEILSPRRVQPGGEVLPSAEIEFPLSVTDVGP